MGSDYLVDKLPLLSQYVIASNAQHKVLSNQISFVFCKVGSQVKPCI